MGRLTVYTDELAESVLEWIASGKSLRSWSAQNDDLPAASTVVLWTHDRPEFAEQYAKARLKQAENLADEIIDIADSSGDDVMRDRLKVDTRKWILSKVLPKVYGDKAQIEHTIIKPEQTAKAVATCVKSLLDSKGIVLTQDEASRFLSELLAAVEG